MDTNYNIKELSEEEFLPLFEKYGKIPFQDVHDYEVSDILNTNERSKVKDLAKGITMPYKLYLGAFDKNNRFVGWSWGFQNDNSTFYMVNSAVLKKHQRKGIYTALLDKCIKITTKKGFQIIYSRHWTTNNAVIIPKLKAGFIISKMEINDKHGALIHLHYYPNKIRREIMDYRSGQTKPSAKIKKLFRI